MIQDLKTRATRIRAELLKPASQGVSLIIGLVIGASLVGPCSSEAPQADHPEHGYASATGSDATWTCSMHSHIGEHAPGQCPICGMDLIPVTSSHQETSEPNNRVVLSERAQALAKLRTTSVRRLADASAELRLLGKFEPNETTLKAVTAWTGGRIDRLHVKVTGEPIRAGQVVATVYSPEVFAAHQDLLVAKRQVVRLESSSETSHQAAKAALEAARERLRLLGVPDDALVQMEKQDLPARTIAIRTPYAGTVIERVATEGSYVSTGTPLYRVADLASLWLQLDAYENDLARLAVGQSVRIDVAARPGETFEGKISFIEPTLDPGRRTTNVRVQVDNSDGELRPGMFAQATVAMRDTTDGPGPLVVPQTAPLFTGRRAIVYVEVPAGDRPAYEPRTVRLGSRLNDVYSVVAGLAEGDRVVTRGAFVLDADLQIRGGASMMSAPDDREAESSPSANLPAPTPSHHHHH